MSQRVNIQYSIEIERLPAEVERLATAAQSNLRELSEASISENPEQVDISLQSVSNINDIREKIASLDHELMDIANIMNGYINYMTTPPEQDEPEQVDAAPIPYDDSELYPASEVTNKLDDLESKLQQFKSNNQGSYDPVTAQKSEFSQEVPKTST